MNPIFPFRDWTRLYDTAESLRKRGVLVAVTNYRSTAVSRLFSDWATIDIESTIRHNPARPMKAVESIFLSY